VSDAWDSPRAYADPYLAGVGIGVVLLLAFVTLGQGLGASGAFASVAAAGAGAVAPGAAAANRSLAPYLDAPGGPLSDWLVIEVVGIAIGGFASAWLAGRVRLEVARGLGMDRRSRLLLAVAGGVLMGFGARLARGCTSGQALSGGAMLSAGSWLFIATAFAAAYALAPVVRRQWT
jgi:uncharacterized protein